MWSRQLSAYGDNLFNGRFTNWIPDNDIRESDYLDIAA
jgi:hypothetical protein